MKNFKQKFKNIIKKNKITINKFNKFNKNCKNKNKKTMTLFCQLMTIK